MSGNIAAVRYAKGPRRCLRSMIEAERDVSWKTVERETALGELLWTLMAFPVQTPIFRRSRRGMLVMSSRNNLQNYTYPDPLFSFSVCRTAARKCRVSRTCSVPLGFSYESRYRTRSRAKDLEF